MTVITVIAFFYLIVLIIRLFKLKCYMNWIIITFKDEYGGREWKKIYLRKPLRLDKAGRTHNKKNPQRYKRS